MTHVNPYLRFPGTTEKAMNFYKSVFGGEFVRMQRYSDLPGAEKMNHGDSDKIIHASLPLGSSLLMATDTIDSMEFELKAGNNFHVCIHAESEAEVDRLFNALAEGGQIEMPVNTTFWGAYFGMCRDQFGIQWMISYEPNPNA